MDDAADDTAVCLEFVYFEAKQFGLEAGFW
jgi:hypothetical protein